MVSVILVSHASLASGFLDASAMIVGPQSQFESISFDHDSNLDTLFDSMWTRAQALDDGDGVLILADLLGGSPANTAAKLVSEQVRLVTGMNLPMLLDVLVNRQTKSLSELARLAVESGAAGVIDIYTMLQEGDVS
ncbi:PTS sugar transporter subunit IIA [Alicyclobacillus dauci]|uniref:PTS EIIA type-4 domain-containing protein n=1 Tax=Alicyclobacillus dauci TaxID=1475485 RepID=A0ABY6YZG5_9BACL|nr:hypothetical protein [Alicyclobacillus dauci]WAH36030.1 hypothetical protein NZD86_17465 [Alicyclobacillus dauci]